MVTDDPVADRPGANSQVVAELTLSLTLYFVECQSLTVAFVLEKPCCLLTISVER